MIITHETGDDGFKLGNFFFQITRMRFKSTIFSRAETYPLLNGTKVHFVFWIPVLSYVDTKFVASHGYGNIASDVLVEIFVFVHGCVDHGDGQC